MNEKTVRKASREEIAQRILVGCGVFGGLVGAASAVLNRLELAIPTPVIGVAAAIAVIGVSVVSLIYWRMIDEAAREAHKFAWFWGGLAGTVVALLLGAFVGSDRLTAIYGDLHPAGWLILGMGALLVAQTSGYALAWAGWWLARQR
jgi:hypothetical protein